jgi:hypothetical protein
LTELVCFPLFSGLARGSHAHILVQVALPDPKGLPKSPLSVTGPEQMLGEPMKFRFMVFKKLHIGRLQNQRDC